MPNPHTPERCIIPPDRSHIKAEDRSDFSCCENTAQLAWRWGQLAFHQDSCIFLYEHQMPCQMIKKRLQEFLSPLQVTALQGNGDETASNSYYW